MCLDYICKVRRVIMLYSMCHRYAVVQTKITACTRVRSTSVQFQFLAERYDAYAVSHRKNVSLDILHNFEKCWPIIKISSLLDSAANLQQDSCRTPPHLKCVTTLPGEIQNINSAFDVFILFNTIHVSQICFYMWALELELELNAQSALLLSYGDDTSQY